MQIAATKLDRVGRKVNALGTIVRVRDDLVAVVDSSGSPDLPDDVAAFLLNARDLWKTAGGASSGAPAAVAPPAQPVPSPKARMVAAYMAALATLPEEVRLKLEEPPDPREPEAEDFFATAARLGTSGEAMALALVHMVADEKTQPTDADHFVTPADRAILNALMPPRQPQLAEPEPPMPEKKAAEPETTEKAAEPPAAKPAGAGRKAGGAKA